MIQVDWRLIGKGDLRYHKPDFFHHWRMFQNWGAKFQTNRYRSSAQQDFFVQIVFLWSQLVFSRVFSDIVYMLIFVRSHSRCNVAFFSWRNIWYNGPMQHLFSWMIWKTLKIFPSEMPLFPHRIGDCLVANAISWIIHNPLVMIRASLCV